MNANYQAAILIDSVSQSKIQERRKFLFFLSQFGLLTISVQLLLLSGVSVEFLAERAASHKISKKLPHCRFEAAESVGSVTV